MITISVEPWERFAVDPMLAVLLREHYEEFTPAHENRLGEGPDFAAYGTLASIGALSIVVARRDGAMIGHCICLVRRHMHYQALCGFEDAYFLTKAERKTFAFTGYKLIKASLDELRRRGCKRAYFMTKEFLPVKRLFAALGGKHIDSVYAFWL